MIDQAIAAIETGEESQLREMLAREPGLTHESFDHSWRKQYTLLHLAVEARRGRCVELLLQAGADPIAHCGAEGKDTPLSHAIRFGWDELVDRLAASCRVPEEPKLLAGIGHSERILEWLGQIGPDAVDQAADAYRLACRCGRSQAAVHLLQFVADHDPDSSKWIELMDGVDRLTRFLVERRHTLHVWEMESFPQWLEEHLREAEPWNVFDFLGDAGEELVSLSREKGHHEITQILRNHRNRSHRPIDPNAWSRPFESAQEQEYLITCEWGPSVKLREMLRVHPELAQVENKWGQNGLDLQGAYSPDRPEDSVRALIAAGADPTRGPLVSAAWWGGVGVLRTLTEAGSNWIASLVDEALWTVAVASRFNGPVQAADFRVMLERLREIGADVNAINRWGLTAWGIAAEELRPILEEIGAKTERHPSALSALHQALDRRDSGAVQQAAADDLRVLGCYREASGLSPVLEAVEADDFEMLAELRTLKVQLDLNEAAAVGEVARLRDLLDHRYRLRRRTHGHGEPERPLHFAARQGQLEAALVLLSYGYSPASPNHAEIDGRHIGPVDRYGVTPLQLAVTRGHEEIVKLFLKDLRRHRP
jgi:hypothetical protein